MLRNLVAEWSSNCQMERTPARRTSAFPPSFFVCLFLFHFLSPFQLSFVFLCSFFLLLLSIFKASTIRYSFSRLLAPWPPCISFGSLQWYIWSPSLTNFFFALSSALSQTLIFFFDSLSAFVIVCVFLFAFFFVMSNFLVNFFPNGRLFFSNYTRNIYLFRPFYVWGRFWMF